MLRFSQQNWIWGPFSTAKWKLGSRKSQFYLYQNDQNYCNQKCFKIDFTIFTLQPVIVDLRTKWALVIPSQIKKTVEQAIYNHSAGAFGYPGAIHFDQDSNYESHLIIDKLSVQTDPYLRSSKPSLKIPLQRGTSTPLIASICTARQATPLLSLGMKYSSDHLVGQTIFSNPSPGSTPTWRSCPIGHSNPFESHRFTTPYHNPFVCFPFFSNPKLCKPVSTLFLSIVIGSYILSSSDSECLCLRSLKGEGKMDVYLVQNQI